MFSLIITIISIALVAALALATIYYGGSAFTQGQASADASRILNQGQQILAAAEMYKVDRGTWPSIDQMVEFKYLKSAPTGMTAVGTAYAQAAGDGWTTPVEGQPVYVLGEIDGDTCQAVNETSYGMDGILAQARTTLATQCYGTSAGYTVVITKNPASLQTVAGDTSQTTITAGDITSDAIPLATETAAWEVAPGETAVAGGGSGTGGGTAPDLSQPLTFVATGLFGRTASLLSDVQGPYVYVGQYSSEEGGNYNITFTNNTSSAISGISAIMASMEGGALGSPFGIDAQSCADPLPVGQSCDMMLYVSFGMNPPVATTDFINYTYTVNGQVSATQSIRVYVDESI